MSKVMLKGGSLSSTFLCDDNGFKYIRKHINLKENREYGFVRWYSQLKKLQRYNTLYPQLCPKVLSTNVTDNEAFFDLEYLSGYKDIKTILSENSTSDYQIKVMSDALKNAFNTLHSLKINSVPNLPYLYYVEEVEQKLNDAIEVSRSRFFDLDEFVYNGKVVKKDNLLNRLKDYFLSLSLPYECNIHGNPTLENIIYSVEKNDIKFIDLYEESIIDSPLLDYSQVLQCSSSFYGFVNDREVKIDGNEVWFEEAIPDSFFKFNEYFSEGLEDITIIKILEATQFFRMLPFKCLAGDDDKAKYFYVHALYLLSEVLN
jgi:aminoglycoside phosphotransferase